jgi:SagB-type dehydrogenase family enzyme
MVQRATSAALVDNGQILLILTARFQRINRFYHTITYALILKHVGVLMQTTYLVASAMNLAICAIGNGDSDLIGQALGLSYFEEGAVGEMLLGRPAID